MKLVVLLLLACFCCSAIAGVHELRLTRKTPLKDMVQQRWAAMSEEERLTSTVPLKGGEDVIGEVYVSFSIGSPAQDFTAQFDTGSSDLAIPGKSCTTCGSHSDSPYNPAASLTSQEETCNHSHTGFPQCPKCSGGDCAYTISYGDGSGFDATVYNDTVTLGSLSSVYQIVGYITHETKSNPTEPFEPRQVDGIMGAAFSSISETKSPTPIDSLYNAGVIDENIFTICMGGEGGTLTVGGEGTHGIGPYTYTGITRDEYFSIDVTGISVYGSNVGAAPSVFSGITIVDSGTTLAYFPNQAYSDLQSAMEGNCTLHHLVGVCGVSGRQSIFNGACVKLTNSELNAYPTVDVLVGSGASQIQLQMQPSTYLQSGFCSGVDEYALAIGKGGLTQTILGDTFMQNFSVVFDKKNNRLGFAPVDSSCG